MGKQILILLVLALSLNACKQIQYDGDSYLNYPDTQMLLEQYLNPYKKLPNTFRVITTENAKRDTQYLKATDMPWKELEAPFLKAGFFDEKNDKQYKIDVLHDTLNMRMSLFYKALNEKAFTQKATIQAQFPNNKVYSMYFECDQNGFFKHQHYKLLYACGKSLQIQSSEKSLLGKEKKKIIQVQFLNGLATP